MARPPALRVVVDEHGFRVGTVGNCLVTARRGAPRAEQMEAQLRVQRELLLQTDPVGGINLLLDPTLRSELWEVDERSRVLIRRAFELSRERVGGIAMIVDGAPFYRASVRAVLSAVNLALRTKMPMRVFDDEAGATAWLAPRIAREGAPDAETLRAALAQFAAPVRGQ